MKIALTIPTGRPRVKQVVKAFIDNAIFHGHDPKNFAVYLSIDTLFNRTRTRDYKLPVNLERSLGKVEYISPGSRKLIGDELINRLDADPKLVNSLFVGRGYSRQRNSALLSALKDGNDFAICFDDDEAPSIPLRSEDSSIRWINPNFFGPHITSLLEGADITRGPCLGYLSPIPSDIEKEVPERIRRRLGEALNPGNEVINEDSFLDLMGRINYLPEDEFYNNSRPYVVEENKHGKPILSGNMGINLKSVRKGKVPIFYTPPNARGEDTFFALQLKDSNVVEVPSYIFHDPFTIYSQVLESRYPRELKHIPITTASKNRFADAVIGWIKYAPLLIHMTSEDPIEREERIGEMMAKIEAPTKKLAEILGCPQLNTCKKVLEQYQEDVLGHYDTLLRSQLLWREKILPAYVPTSVLV